MSGSLPGGAKRPIEFKPGQPLTADELNAVQTELLSLILTHTHAGNVQPSPQGVKLGSEAIADDAIKGKHIHTDAITRGHIAAGEVGSSELAERAVAGNHLQDNTVVTRTILDKNVTLAKLADEVLALLKAPREGATTYGYFAYLDGTIVFPPPSGGQWWDWLVKADGVRQVHDLPIIRKRDDGGVQPVDTILPPSAIFPHIRLPDTFAVDLSNAVTPRTETASRLSMTDRAVEVPDSAPLTVMSTVAPRDEVTPIKLATPVDLVERDRVSMSVDPTAIGWKVGMEGSSTFHPGTGGNQAFSETGEPMQFDPGRAPSAKEKTAIERMLYHYGIEEANLSLDTLLRSPKIYDFLNNPHLLASGYWTGSSRNVRSVVRMQEKGPAMVRIRFAVPYADSSYAVTVTPELGADNRALTPMVIRRSKEYVDVVFLSDGAFFNKVNFNLTIHGELAPV